MAVVSPRLSYCSVTMISQMMRPVKPKTAPDMAVRNRRRGGELALTAPGRVSGLETHPNLELNHPTRESLSGSTEIAAVGEIGVALATRLKRR
jgi:hypothetical protein